MSEKAPKYLVVCEDGCPVAFDNDDLAREWMPAAESGYAILLYNCCTGQEYIDGEWHDVERKPTEIKQTGDDAK